MKKTQYETLDDVNKVKSKPFSQMNAIEKVRHIGKVVVFFLTFGFAFPNVFSD
jgi:hypothetical protein